MRIIRSIKQMADYVKGVKLKDESIGFVPTMGYLHQGHLSLMRKARQDTDVVVISIFVNPIQFGPKEDFRSYPRNLKRDQRLAEDTGVDIIFYPSQGEIYPEDYLTYVNVERITDGLCGASRPGHFKGVATVVNKLFNIVQPDIAYFGQKDAQQAIVIKKMVEDLNMPVKIKVLPIVREPDGLAMSSRNTYLNPRQRKDALVLYRSLLRAKEMIREGERDSGKIIGKMRGIIKKAPYSEIDYISTVDAKNLNPLKKLSGRVLIALAVRIGKTRLIDNITVKV